MSAPVRTSAPVDWSHPLNRGRILWLRALNNRWGGNRFVDLTGRWAGTLSGSGLSWRPTPHAPSVDFTGVNNGRVTLGNQQNTPLDLTGTANVTLAAWVWIRSYQANAPNIRCVAGTEGTSPQYYLRLGDSGTSNKFQWGVARPTESKIFTAATVPLGTWLRVVGTYDGATQAIYVNGVLSASQAITGNLGSAGSSNWLVGESNTGNRPFDGMIADVSCWSRRLTAAEVAADYALSAKGYPFGLRRVPARHSQLLAHATLLDGLLAYYRLSGDLTDATGNGNTLTGSGAAFGSGVLGGALTAGSATRTSITGLTDAGVTLSYWVRGNSAVVFPQSGLVAVGDGFGAGDGITVAEDNANVVAASVNVVSNTAALTNGVYNHVVLSFGSGTFAFFVNGVSQSVSNLTPPPAGWSARPFALAASNGSGDVTPVSAVGVWGRKLSAVEVLRLYNSGLGLDPTRPGGVCATFDLLPRVDARARCLPRVSATAEVEAC